MSVKCPCCGADAKVKYGYVDWDDGTGIIPANVDGEFVLRYFIVQRKYNRDTHDYETTYRELLRETFHENGTFSAADRRWDDDEWLKCKLPYGQYRISYYTHRPLGTHVHVPNENVTLYTRNLNRYSKGTNFERLDINKMLNRKNKFIDRYEVWSFIDDINSGYANIYESLVKCGLSSLAYQFMFKDRMVEYDSSQTSIIKFFNLKPYQFKQLLELKDKATVDMIRRMQMKNKYDLKTEEELDVFIKLFGCSYSNLWKADRFFEVYKSTLHKLNKYMNGKDDFDIAYYIDYLSTCRKLDLDMKNDFVIFPNNLQKAHDTVTDMYNEMQFDLKLKKYADNANEYSDAYSKLVSAAEEKYTYDNGNLQIVVPKTTREIGLEGYKLRHCVAQYMEDITKGEKTILFVRNKDELDVPYYTMEIIGNEITQCKGYRNRKRSDDVQDFLNNFAKEYHLSISKNEHFAAVM